MIQTWRWKTENFDCWVNEIASYHIELKLMSNGDD